MALPELRPLWPTESVQTFPAQRPSSQWDEARNRLDGLPEGRGLNIAYEALDRHALHGRGDQVAIQWVPREGDAVSLTYQDLVDRTNRFANALAELGYETGHGVATLAGRIPDLYVAALGTLKSRGIYTPLFSAFGPDPIAMRLNLGRIAVLVTTAAQYRRKVAALRPDLPSLQHVLISGDGAEEIDDPTVLDLNQLLERAADHYEIGPTDPEDRALLHFTSGTTGTPKGALHVHQAVEGHAETGRLALDLRSSDTFWCTADPGWVTGTSYGIISPLVNGVTSIVDEADFDPERWYRILQDQQVSVFYTAPTALRMLQRAGDELAAGHKFPSLRLVASVGEPLDPESVIWAQRVFQVPVLDNWWQTETGGIMISNLIDHPVKPGSMGKPLPGITAGLLKCDEQGELVVGHDGDPVEITTADEVGELALEAGWPSMFRGYLDNEERYRACFAGRWYHSGDLARRDSDGYFWFVGRNDDVIKSAGHLIGPFEVESALTEHPAVVEAGVIGKPDERVGNIVKAFVVLANSYAPSEELRRDLIGHARSRLGAAVAPREIQFSTSLPHTRSGKIMRRLLRARELNLDEGDTSTLESQA
ncbi:MAG: acetate--CoA ligase [Acidimicrobiales bacterium]|nr:acetate--CoA ligase [Acidimicrobiales bacterium]